MLVASNVVGAEVREARRELGLTIEELGKRAGLNKETVRLVEAGGNARLSTLDKLRVALPRLSRLDVKEGGGVHDVHVQRIQHMVAAIQSPERLAEIREFVFKRLADEVKETRHAEILEDLARRDEREDLKPPTERGNE
jgi:transcriptional regulator with XRE-family HTH domain